MSKVTKANGFFKGDLIIWTIMFLLCMVSLVEVYSASSNMTYKTGHYWGPVMDHGVLVGVAIVVAWLMHNCKLTYIKGILLILYPTSLILLAYVYFFGETVNGANRYLPSVMGLPSFQPSELAKLALVGVAALILSVGHEKKRDKTDRRFFFALMVFTAVTCGAIVSENLSTAIIIALTMVILAWIANPPAKLFYGIMLSLGALAMGGYLFLKNVNAETIQHIGVDRMTTWVNRIQSSDSLPTNPRDYDIYDNIQKTHAKIAVASAGLTGVGTGQSVERDFLPQAYSDFIFAIIIEEGGFAAAIFVMALYLLLLFRSIRIAQRCKSKFPSYLVLGLSMMLVIQAMVNMAVAVGAIPVTGQPLPLVSRGGTSVIICGMYIGIILRVSYGVQKKDAKQIEETTETI